ncbi:dihydropteroate synthase [Candidatus Electronema sp. TJ]|uniref:dihydropteroate synthase n=1 Tax=Candidatus Electronema sp. TJ TaxID=3401573 RepID=UPI003AA805B3
MKKPQLMGILNVTPDSFSDGGSFFTAQSLLRQAERLLAEGADIIDIGGESTRPFAQPVAEEEELRRIVPAIEAVRSLSAAVPISIDTTKAAVARAALAAGATMLNDISALRHDPAMLDAARSFDGPVIIMHMQGTPGNMQRDPQYNDVVREICAFFQERTAWMEAQGIRRERIILDPGIGFGKTLEHNLAILRKISAFKQLGFPVLIGHSRKSFLGKLLGLPTEERDWATALVSALCAKQGADMLRVHDVAKTAAALRLAKELEPQAA